MINIYTKEEAETKDCPADVNVHCNTSGCMAWLWQENVRDKDTLEEILKYGYCGLVHKRNVVS